MNPLIPLPQLLSASRPASLCVTPATPDSDAINWDVFANDIILLSHAMRSHPAQRWALAIDDSYHFATAFLALCYAKKQLVLPGNLQPQALEELSEHYDVLLHDDREFAATNADAIALSTMVSSFPPITADQMIETPPPFARIDLTLFTSGSSGKAKPIKKNLDQLQTEIHQLEQCWGTLLAQSTIYSTVSHQHIYGLLFRLLWPLCAGRPFTRTCLNYPEQVLTHAKPNHTLISSPALLKRLTAVPDSGHYRAIFSSGGPLPFTACQHSHTILGQQPIEVYGSTETGGIGFRQQFTENAPWTFFPEINAALDEHGCLQLRSPYIDRQNSYQTTDHVQLMNHRQFLLLGRADRIVKIEEKRVSLPEIELRLQQHHWITDAAVVVLTTPNRDIIGAAITLTPHGKKAQALLTAGKFTLQLRQQLRASLEPVAVPRRIKVVDAIPQNEQGKSQQHLIAALFFGSRATPCITSGTGNICTESPH